MKAVDNDGNLISDRYLHTMYHAYRHFPDPKSLFERSLQLSDIVPNSNDAWEGGSVYYGDIFSEMVMGNLVHTSTVLLRADRCREVGLFREDFRMAGEDYDYHLRTCREGDVAYIDVSSITYQVGRPDQLTVLHKKEMAINFFRTIEPLLRNDRARIKLPEIMINKMLSSSYAWLGEKLLDDNDMRGAARAFRKSLYHRLNEPRIICLYLISLLPSVMVNRIRHGYRIVKASLQMVKLLSMLLWISIAHAQFIHVVT